MSDENDDLWNEAMALLLRWQASPDDKDLREEILSFCAQSEAHHAAWNGAKRLYRLTGEATGAETPDQKRRRSRAVTRRKVLAGAGVFIAGASVLEGPRIWRRWGADMISGIGQIEQHRLPDGSRIVLGPDSVLELAVSSRSRSINLIEGMALLEVASEQSGPFQARTGDIVATASAGMSFEIRQNGGRSLVGADKGKILIDVAGQPRSTLANGEWLATEADSPNSRRGHRDADHIAAWRQHLLVAEQDRVDSIVAEISRWQSARVVIGQTNLATSRVSGLYDLTDPRAALAAVVEPYGGRVREITPWLIVLSTI